MCYSGDILRTSRKLNTVDSILTETWNLSYSLLKNASSVMSPPHATSKTHILDFTFHTYIALAVLVADWSFLTLHEFGAGTNSPDTDGRHVNCGSSSLVRGDVGFVLRISGCEVMCSFKWSPPMISYFFHSFVFCLLVQTSQVRHGLWSPEHLLFYSSFCRIVV